MDRYTRIFTCTPFCSYIYLPISFYLFISIYQPISICISIFPSACIAIHLSIYLSINLSLRVKTDLVICLAISICLSVYLSFSALKPNELKISDRIFHVKFIIYYFFFSSTLSHHFSLSFLSSFPVSHTLLPSPRLLPFLALSSGGFVRIS